MDYYNPADFTWGHVEDEPIGYFKDLVERTADIAFTAAAVDRKVCMSLKPCFALRQNVL